MTNQGEAHSHVQHFYTYMYTNKQDKTRQFSYLGVKSLFCMQQSHLFYKLNPRLHTAWLPGLVANLSKDTSASIKMFQHFFQWKFIPRGTNFQMCRGLMVPKKKLIHEIPAHKFLWKLVTITIKAASGDEWVFVRWSTPLHTTLLWSSNYKTWTLMGRWTNELHTTTCIYNMLNGQYVMLLYTMWTPSYEVNVQMHEKSKAHWTLCI